VSQHFNDIEARQQPVRIAQHQPLLGEEEMRDQHQRHVVMPGEPAAHLILRHAASALGTLQRPFNEMTRRLHRCQLALPRRGVHAGIFRLQEALSSARCTSDLKPPLLNAMWPSAKSPRVPRLPRALHYNRQLSRLPWNRCPASDGITVQVALESVSSLGWNSHSISAAVTMPRNAHFAAVTQSGCTHSPTVMSGPDIAQRRPALNWVDTMLGNVKNAIHGTYHAIRPKHLPRYLAEFCYRFNRRFDLASLLKRLATAATRTPPMPYRLVKLAEAHW